MRLHRLRDDTSAVGFGFRLALAFTAALVLVGVAGYMLLDRQAEDRLVHSYALEQKAEAESFELVAREAPSREAALEDIDDGIRALAARPDTNEVLLLDSRRVVRAAGDAGSLGRRDSDPGIEAAFEHGKAYAGHESDPDRPSSDFEFLVPLDLRGERYVFEITRDSRFLQSQLSDLRRTLGLVGLLALVLGGGAFYLVGGRPLMRSHKRVLQRATRDGLTDLPNQRAFQEDFPHAVAMAQRAQGPLAVAILDIDDFKFMNDRHGHAHGDARIRLVAEVLGEGRVADRAFRVGGDEFALLMPTDLAGAREMARRLSRRFAEAEVSVSIGVSEMVPGADPLTLRAEADAAMYEAKRLGGNRAVFFRDVSDEVSFTSLEKMMAVRGLLEERRLETCFQPIWNLRDATLIGFEALSRPDPSYGFAGPTEMFDVAERIGRVRELDQLCIAGALRSLPDLPEGVLLFLNLAPATLDLDVEEDGWLAPAVEAAGLAPEQVVVEVTERFGARTGSVIKSLLRLRAAGFKLALDDVGTGNAGLEMLRRVDAEFVKIDGGIVAAAPTEPASRAVLMAMATFAHQTGAFVIAEGIEDEDTLAFVRSADNADLSPGALIGGGQGFGLGRPELKQPYDTAALARPFANPAGA